MTARYLTNGSLDVSFGNGGYVAHTFGETDNGSAGDFVLIDAENRILVSGFNNFDGTLVRYLENGALDTTFGVNGIITFSADTVPVINYLNGIAIDSQDRIVLAGRNLTYPGDVEVDSFLVIRLNQNGTLDTSFNTTGYVVLNIDYPVGEVATNTQFGLTLDASDRILLSGVINTLEADSSLIMVARLNTNGSLDTSFVSPVDDLTGAFYFHASDTSTVDGGYTINIDSQGRILIGGVSDNTVMLCRLLSNGSFDATFKNGGRAIYTYPDLSGAGMSTIMFDAYQRIVGVSYLKNGADVYGFTVMRFDQNGNKDTSFGTNGITHTIINSTSTYSFYGVLDQQARIVVVGGVGDNLALGRYTTSYSFPYYQAQFTGTPLGFIGSNNG